MKSAPSMSAPKARGEITENKPHSLHQAGTAPLIRIHAGQALGQEGPVMLVGGLRDEIDYRLSCRGTKTIAKLPGTACGAGNVRAQSARSCVNKEIKKPTTIQSAFTLLTAFRGRQRKCLSRQFIMIKPDQLIDIQAGADRLELQFSRLGWAYDALYYGVLSEEIKRAAASVVWIVYPDQDRSVKIEPEAPNRKAGYVIFENVLVEEINVIFRHDFMRSLSNSIKYIFDHDFISAQSRWLMYYIRPFLISIIRSNVSKPVPP
jgi:hypothetical protein